MTLKNNFFLVFFLFFISCEVKAIDIVTCENYYKKNELKQCFVCTKEYLESNSIDIEAVSLAVKCARSEDELDFIDSFMILQYSELKEEFFYWLTYGDLKMKMKDSMRANLAYLNAKEINSNFININYKIALTDFAWYKAIDKSNGYYSDAERKSSLYEILNHINKELINSPEDSASLALKNKVEALINSL